MRANGDVVGETSGVATYEGAKQRSGARRFKIKLTSRGERLLRRNRPRRVRVSVYASDASLGYTFNAAISIKVRLTSRATTLKATTPRR